MGTPLFTGDVFQWARFCNADLESRQGAVIHTLRRGGGSAKNCFSFGLKIREAPPLDLPLICQGKYHLPVIESKKMTVKCSDHLKVTI